MRDAGSEQGDGRNKSISLLLEFSEVYFLALYAYRSARIVELDSGVSSQDAAVEVMDEPLVWTSFGFEVVSMTAENGLIAAVNPHILSAFYTVYCALSLSQSFVVNARTIYHALKLPRSMMTSAKLNGQAGPCLPSQIPRVATRAYNHFNTIDDAGPHIQLNSGSSANSAPKHPMRLLFKSLLVALLALMFRSPILQLQRTARQFARVIPEAIQNSSKNPLTAGDMARPSGLIAKEGLEVLTFGTPNGHKATILLEELKAAYGKNYTFQSISIMENIQKEPWFTALGPNGRIPVLVDHDKDKLSIMEGQAILQYLTRHYDVEYRFSFTSDPELSKCEQWVAWQHGGLGPMQGQANHFYRLAKERIPYPTQRYVGETERLYGILDAQLKDTEYLVGGKYSIADIANFSWVNIAYFSGVDLSQFPNLQKWWERINARGAVQKGISVPNAPQITNERYLQRLKEEPEFKQKEDELRELGNKAKQQYGYKYSSP